MEGRLRKEENRNRHIEKRRVVRVKEGRGGGKVVYSRQKGRGTCYSGRREEGAQLREERKGSHSQGRRRWETILKKGGRREMASEGGRRDR